VPDIDATYQVFGYRVTQDVMIASGNLQWPYHKFHHTFLVAGGAEVTALAGKCQEVFVAAVFAFHTGKSVMQIAAIEIPVKGRGGEYRQIAAPGIAREGLTFTFRDAGFDPGTAYRYRVDVTDDEGARVLFETSQLMTPALPLGLDQNFPNPFNPSTAIAYYLPRDSKVALEVYDVSGRLVASLVERAEKKGRHSVSWNGKDETGSSVGSGVYFYRLTVGKETVSKKMKMILLR
jgi:hypothetical protein